MCVYFYFNFCHCVYPLNHKILWYRTFDSLSPTFIDVLLQIVSIVNSGLGAGSLLEIYLLSWKCFQSSSSRLHPAGERSRFRILSRETTTSRQQSSAQWDVRRTNPFTLQNYLLILCSPSNYQGPRLQWSYLVLGRHREQWRWMLSTILYLHRKHTCLKTVPNPQVLPLCSGAGQEAGGCLFNKAR